MVHVLYSSERYLRKEGPILEELQSVLFTCDSRKTILWDDHIYYTMHICMRVHIYVCANKI